MTAARAGAATRQAPGGADPLRCPSADARGPRSHGRRDSGAAAPPQVLELSGNGKQTNKKAENRVVMSRRSKEYHRSSTGGVLVDPPPHACQQGAATRMATAIFVPDHLPILSHPDRYTSAEGAKAQRCWGIYSVQLSG
ncbi:uncharacterized protein C4orf19 homolog isoform X3 [Rattus norvegicus]|nr:uncharacterized protein C4orf19 homolog isoform X2 [Rattus norvegicus]